MARGKHLLIESLLAQGVRYIFGNPGSTEAPLTDLLPDYPQIEYILALHESIALGMADAYALATGQVGVVNLHVAPGLGNSLGMLFNALEGGSPIVVTAGQADTRMRLRGPLLSHDLVAMAAPLTKWSVQAERADELPWLLHRAFKIALEPPSGPVFVSLPVNVLEEKSQAPLLPPSGLFHRVHPDPEGLEKAADILLNARNPVILCGDGVFRAGAQDELVAVAELLGAPVWNTLLTAAVNFPTTHPQLRGELMDNHAQIRECLGEPDAVLLVGGHFFREVFYTPESPWPREAAVIQIEAAPELLARNFAVSAGLVADPKVALGQLYRLLSSRATTELYTAARARREALATLKAEEQRRHAQHLQDNWEAEPMTSARFLGELKNALPPDVVVVGEVNTCRDDLLRTIPFERAGDYYGSRGGGIGQGLPGALGIRLAHPHRPVLALSGDGSSLYSIQALWTAAHHRLPVVFAILNNHAYRILKFNMDRHRRRFELDEGRPYRFMDLTDPDIDYVQLAQGFGVPGRHVVEPEDVGPAFREAFASSGPYLLDVLVDTDCSVLLHDT